MLSFSVKISSLKLVTRNMHALRGHEEENIRNLKRKITSMNFHELSFFSFPRRECGGGGRRAARTVCSTPGERASVLSDDTWRRDTRRAREKS